MSPSFVLYLTEGVLPVVTIYESIPFCVLQAHPYTGHHTHCEHRVLSSLFTIRQQLRSEGGEITTSMQNQSSKRSEISDGRQTTVIHTSSTEEWTRGAFSPLSPTSDSISQILYRPLSQEPSTSSGDHFRPPSDLTQGAIGSYASHPHLQSAASLVPHTYSGVDHNELVDTQYDGEAAIGCYQASQGVDLVPSAMLLDPGESFDAEFQPFDFSDWLYTWDTQPSHTSATSPQASVPHCIDDPWPYSSYSRKPLLHEPDPPVIPAEGLPFNRDCPSWDMAGPTEDLPANLVPSPTEMLGDTLITTPSLGAYGNLDTICTAGSLEGMTFGIPTDPDLSGSTALELNPFLSSSHSLAQDVSSSSRCASQTSHARSAIRPNNQQVITPEQRRELDNRSKARYANSEKGKRKRKQHFDKAARRLEGNEIPDPSMPCPSCILKKKKCGSKNNGESVSVTSRSRHPLSCCEKAY
jgi:hypothetical protein